MARILAGTRYLILLPILGLALAAAFFFVFGGLGLFRVLLEFLNSVVDPAHETISQELFIVEVVTYVHTFLIGTVLYITAVGFYQLFIRKIELHGWLKVESTEDLETNLISVTVVVLAVEFMGAVFSKGALELLQLGVGLALLIAALGLFVGLRAWSSGRSGQEMIASEGSHETKAAGNSGSHEPANDLDAR